MFARLRLPTPTRAIFPNQYRMHSRTTPISIIPSTTEVLTGKLTPRNLEIGIRALFEDGIVILKDAIPPTSLLRLNDKMLHDAVKLQSRGDASPWNYHLGNIQQDPPLTAEYWKPEIFVNPLVTHLTTTHLGPPPTVSFVSANTAVAHSPLSQPIHTDASFSPPPVPFALVINIPLTTTTIHNGATEIWLGTHDSADIDAQEGKQGERASGMIKKDLLEKRRSVRPPGRLEMAAGSIAIRDLRLWHCGKGNKSSGSRVMLALIHFAPWYRNSMQIEMAEELRPEATVEKTGLNFRARFLKNNEVERRYLNRPFGNAYNFDQEDKVVGVI